MFREADNILQNLKLSHFTFRNFWSLFAYTLFKNKTNQRGSFPNIICEKNPTFSSKCQKHIYVSIKKDAKYQCEVCGMTKQEKTVLHIRFKKRKVLKLCSGRCARKTLQKFGCSVLVHMGTFFSNLDILLIKVQLTSDITSKFGYSGIISIICFLLSKTRHFCRKSA